MDFIGAATAFLASKSRSLVFLFSIFIGVQLICNVVQFQIYSNMNQLCTCTYALFFRFFSHTHHCRVLGRVPCAIQQILIVYLFYIQQHVYVNPNLPLYPSSFYLHHNHKFVFYICDSISVLQISSFVPFFLGSTHKYFQIMVFSGYMPRQN